MRTRLRSEVKHPFDCFVEVAAPNGSDEQPWILQTYPTNYKDKEADKLKSVPQFVFPCSLEITQVQNFSFVMTNLEGKWTFGFCRHAPNSETALVLLSSLPWHETFYKLLNHAAELVQTNDVDVWKFLEACYNARIPDSGSVFHVQWGDNHDFTCQTPHELNLPSIPENRNLTEYYNALDPHNMMVIFASMLYERRIIITSKRLNRLSACVQAAEAIIYPMQWQHIFIPILPKKMMDIISAPMPFLIGVPAPIMQRINRHELGEAVILDADENKIESPFTDLESLPNEVRNGLQKELKKDLLGDHVSRAFLQALVHLIGGYRDALKFRQGEKITFSDEAFVQSRSENLQVFLRDMLELQIFRQFIEERLAVLNSGKGFSDEFEIECVRFHERSLQKRKYGKFADPVRKRGGDLVKAVRVKANPAMKTAVRNVREGSKVVQTRGKNAYKEIRSKMRESTKTHSAPSSPTTSRRAMSISSADSGSSGGSDQPPLTTKSASILPGGLTRNNTDLNFVPNRVLKYEKFDPPSLWDKERSPEMEKPPRLDLDLMQDLKDVIFKSNEGFRGSEQPPTVDRKLKPPLHRTSGVIGHLGNVAHVRSLHDLSSYENLVDNNTTWDESKELEVCQVDPGSGADPHEDPFSTDHVEAVLAHAPLTRTDPNGPSGMETNGLDGPTRPPRKRSNPVTATKEEPTPDRQSSIGDLISLDTRPSPDSIEFDPLLEKKPLQRTNPFLSNGGPVRNHSANKYENYVPPCGNSNPQYRQFLASMTGPTQMTLPTGPQMPGPQVTLPLAPGPQGTLPLASGPQGTLPLAPGLPRQSVSPVSSLNRLPSPRSPHSASSDDLLQEYGLDFSRMGVSAARSNDIFAELDPLRSTASPAAPVVPPRAKRQQNWTTFE